MKKNKKFIFITGGVISGLGKGLTAASIANLLEHRGLSVEMVKLDPYINLDPGTMSPFQHGEVFVTDDGAETDLDLGHYERFTNVSLSRKNNYTSGQIYYSVIQRERAGEYLGKTVQVIPHITNDIKEKILHSAGDSDVCFVEVGGTVGDIESLPFLEAIRQMKRDLGEENVLYIHVVLVPFIKAAQELKTKPAQHSVQKLREIGISPQILVCRSETALPEDVVEKVALFCDIKQSHVIQAWDAESIYDVPLILHEQGTDDKIVELLGIWTAKPKLREWEKFIHTLKNPEQKITIGIVGKYTEFSDSYKSLNEALVHAGVAHSTSVELNFIDAESFDEDVLKKCQGILVPGGFGERGSEGKIKAIHYARIHKIPFFGICLGMQLMCIEFARNVLKISGSTSREFNESTKDAVIDYMKGQSAKIEKGGTMRLGAYTCSIKKGTRAFDAYNKSTINERHRHRLEFNNDYRKKFEAKGMVFSGINPEHDLVEISELKDHPWMLGCQFHPEFKSKPLAPHPLFKAFIEHALAFAHNQPQKEEPKKKKTKVESASKNLGPRKKRVNIHA